MFYIMNSCRSDWDFNNVFYSSSEMVYICFTQKHTHSNPAREKKNSGKEKKTFDKDTQRSRGYSAVHKTPRNCFIFSARCDSSEIARTCECAELGG